MVFSSIIFLLFFLPLAILGYFIVPKKIHNVYLLLISLVFYFWGENWLVWIIIVRTIIDYFCALLIEGIIPIRIKKYCTSGKTLLTIRKLALFISIFSNLAFLGYFKYFNFFIDNFYITLQHFDINASVLGNFPKIALPLGISFYTFQSMSYTLDVYYKKVKATINYFNFACYVVLFPQLVAGPIVRYLDIENQLKNRDVSSDDFFYGIKRFTYGLAKKVLIANNVAHIVNQIFTIPAEHIYFSVAWFGVIAYSLQLYFDFSGYSDMAIGMGRMFGFKFPENFNYPYVSQSIQEFWRRWHISLSTWFRDYLYIPLGGNRCGKFRMHMNLVLVFFLCGFWHGASWNFIIWGIYHGVFLILERVGLDKILNKTPKIIRHLYTLIVVMFSWVIFRADTLSYGVEYLTAMIMPIPAKADSFIAYPITMYANRLTVIVIIIGILVSMSAFPWAQKHYDNRLKKSWFSSFSDNTIDIGHSFITLITIMSLLLLSLANLSIGGFNPFLYFRF